MKESFDFDFDKDREMSLTFGSGRSGSHLMSSKPVNSNLRRISERGQSMVEMAFVLPLFLALVFAIIEIGRAWSTKQSLTLAAREGARVLVLPYGAGLTFSTEGAQQQAAIDAVTSYLRSSGVVLASGTQIVPIRLLPGSDGILSTADDVIEQNYSGAKRGERVGIQLRHEFDTPLPILFTMFGNNNSTTGTSDTGSSGQSKINMGVTCYLEHE